MHACMHARHSIQYMHLDLDSLTYTTVLACLLARTRFLVTVFRKFPAELLEHISDKTLPLQVRVDKTVWSGLVWTARPPRLMNIPK